MLSDGLRETSGSAWDAPRRIDTQEAGGAGQRRIGLSITGAGASVRPIHSTMLDGIRSLAAVPPDRSRCLDRDLTVLIAIDDRTLERQVARMMRFVGGVSVVGTCRDEAAILEEARRLEPDVVLMDADDARSDGLRVAASLNQSAGPDVIVLSASDRLAVVAFDSGALDYMVTPLRDTRFRTALDRARLHCAERLARQAALAEDAEAGVGPTILIPDRHGGRDVRVRDIVWIGADRDYALIHATERTYLLRTTMKRLEAALPPDIVRVHRSALVALKHVRRWKAPVNGVHGLLLSDGTELTVGPSYLPDVRQALRSLER